MSKLARTFVLDDSEMKQVYEWSYNHNCTVTDVGAIGGRLTYQFTPTGLGDIQEVICACGEELNLTNFEDW